MPGSSRMLTEQSPGGGDVIRRKTPNRIFRKKCHSKTATPLDRQLSNGFLCSVVFVNNPFLFVQILDIVGYYCWLE